MKRLCNVTEKYTNSDSDREITRMYTFDCECRLIHFVDDVSEKVCKYNNAGDLVEERFYLKSDGIVDHIDITEYQYCYGENGKILAIHSINKNHSSDMLHVYRYYGNLGHSVISFSQNDPKYVECKAYNKKGLMTNLKIITKSLNEISANAATIENIIKLPIDCEEVFYYDENDYLIQWSMGDIRIKYWNDSYGNPVEIMISEPDNDPTILRCEYEYDVDGDIVYEIDSDNHKWSFYYNNRDDFEPGKTCAPRNHNDIYELGNKYKELFK